MFNSSSSQSAYFQEAEDSAKFSQFQYLFYFINKREPKTLLCECFMMEMFPKSTHFLNASREYIIRKGQFSFTPLAFNFPHAVTL